MSSRGHPLQIRRYEPFTLVNSPPVKVGAVALHLINTPSGQVRVTPHKSEGIEPFTLVNSLPGQVEDASLHLINTPSGQVRVTPRKSEGIEPFTTLNSPLCQVGVTPRNSEGCHDPFLKLSLTQPLQPPFGRVYTSDSV